MLLLKNADIYTGCDKDNCNKHTMCKKNEFIRNTDILIDSGRIVDIEDHIPEAGKEVMDCSGKLVIPGLINAHLHSDENFFKGMFDNLPLELWMLYSCPPLAYGPFSEELIYWRTMLGALEMIKCGVTCVQDDVSECPQGTFAGYDAVFRAYADIGMKANIGLNMGNKKYCDKIPYAREVFPQKLQKLLDAGEGEEQTAEQNLALYKEIIKKWHQKAGMKVVMSTSAPQRCSDAYLMQARRFSEEYDLPMHTHILESRIQACTGREFYGESIVKHAARIGFLSERLSVIHGVWMNEEDMQLLASAGATLISNPVSNLKLGSGIAPLMRMQKAGIHIVLGTDGMSSNDGQNLFEAMKYAALLQKTVQPDYAEWPDSGQILQMVFSHAAKSLGREKEIGTIEIGKAADVAVLNKNNTPFIPENQIGNHLVYCENGESVEAVFINGNKVYGDGRILTVNEKEILAKINNCYGDFRESYEKTKKENSRLEPYVKMIYEKCRKEMDAM